MAILFASPLRLTWNPGVHAVVILEYGDDLASLPEISGQKLAQQSQLIRAAGVRYYDRGNRATAVRFAKRIEYPGLEEALAASFADVASLPAGQADVLVEIQGQSAAYLIKNAVISSWDAGIDADAEVLAIVGRSISGGELIVKP